jgi:hypothetical protein
MGTMQAKLHRLEGSSELVDPKKKEEATKKLEKNEKEWKRRRRMVCDIITQLEMNNTELMDSINLHCCGQCLDVVDAISEGMGKKPSEVKEETGIEGDEEVGVELEPPQKRRKK